MAQWGGTDATGNSVLWAPSQVRLTPNTDNRDDLFGNTTENAFTSGATVGMFGFDSTETGVSNGSVIAIEVVTGGSGYFANVDVTVDGNATANGQANATGRIGAVNIVLPGNSYSSSPSVVVDPPAAVAFNANTTLYHTEAGLNANNDVDEDDEFIAISSNPFSDGDALDYLVAASNTAIGGLANGTTYYVVSANSTGVKLAATAGGDAIDLTKGPTETGHSLTRADGFIEIASNKFQNDDAITYLVAASNTAISEIANNTTYYVTGANSSGIRLATTVDGTPLVLTPGETETGHTFTGETATATASISGGHGITHAGWQLRTVGSGGRAGRVQYETLVAMGSLTEDAEDTVGKDA